MPLELWVLTVLLIFVFIFNFYFNDIFNVRNTYKFKKKKNTWFGTLNGKSPNFYGNDIISNFELCEFKNLYIII